jgi:hypothetical protein
MREAYRYLLLVCTEAFQRREYAGCRLAAVSEALPMNVTLPPPSWHSLLCYYAAELFAFASCLFEFSNRLWATPLVVGTVEADFQCSLWDFAFASPQYSLAHSVVVTSLGVSAVSLLFQFERLSFRYAIYGVLPFSSKSRNACPVVGSLTRESVL